MQALDNMMSSMLYKQCFHTVFGAQLENAYPQEEAQERMANCLSNFVKASQFMNDVVHEHHATLPVEITFKSL